jgi:hypothetical protein
MDALRALERLYTAHRPADARGAAELQRATAAVKSALAVTRPWNARAWVPAWLDEAPREVLRALLDEHPRWGGRPIASAAEVAEARRALAAY